MCWPGWRRCGWLTYDARCDGGCNTLKVELCSTELFSLLAFSLSVLSLSLCPSCDAPGLQWLSLSIYLACSLLAARHRLACPVLWCICMVPATSAAAVDRVCLHGQSYYCSTVDCCSAGGAAIQWTPAALNELWLLSVGLALLACASLPALRMGSPSQSCASANASLQVAPLPLLCEVVQLCCWKPDVGQCLHARD